MEEVKMIFRIFFDPVNLVFWVVVTLITGVILSKVYTGKWFGNFKRGAKINGH